MSFYSTNVFPRLYDCFIDRPFWAHHRREQLANAHGDILEIGVGTGLNLPHYPDHVRKITAVDPNPGMNKKLERREKLAEIVVDQHETSSERLPFSESTFDTIVSTITLCSISDAEQAVSELYRVLKPGGCILFLEHGISPDSKVLKWQRRLNWLQRRFADGCTLTLNVGKLLATQPFDSVEFDNFYMEHTPKTHGYMYRGVARK